MASAEQDEWADDGTDETLVRAVIAGKRAAEEAFYQKFRLIVKNIARKYASDEENARDLYQHIWIHLLLILPRWHPTGSLGAWITKVAVNKALSWYRSHKQRAEQSLEEMAESGREFQHNSLNPAQAMEQSLVMESFYECLEALANSNHRYVVELRLQGYSYEEICNILNAPISTVGTWIKRAMSAMKSCLESRIPGFFSS